MTLETDPLLSTSNLKKKSKVKYYHNENVGLFERRRRRKGIQKYIDSQSSLLVQYEEDKQRINSVEERNKEDERGPDRLLARLAFILNIFLLFANLTASYLSGSLAVISTFLDSVMDISSSVILGIILILIKNANTQNYPRGREKLELIGVVLCSVIMGIGNMVMIMQSVTAILTDQMTADIDIYIIGLLLGGSAIKGILMIACFKRGSPACKVLGMDMRNDIATSLVALISASIADEFWRYADPIGAICVCSLIAYNWFSHAFEHIPVLVGVRADSTELSRILRIALEHDIRILKIDHIMVYHQGEQSVVELHIVLDENLPLKITHDISHPLEEKLGRLDFVERAFVHCDYRLDGDGHI